jgi:hypothetical protein
MGTVRRVSRNVKYWRSPSMALRWAGAAMQEAALLHRTRILPKPRRLRRFSISNARFALFNIKRDIAFLFGLSDIVCSYEESLSALRTWFSVSPSESDSTRIPWLMFQ